MGMTNSKIIGRRRVLAKLESSALQELGRRSGSLGLGVWSRDLWKLEELGYTRTCSQKESTSSRRVGYELQSIFVPIRHHESHPIQSHLKYIQESMISSSKPHISVNFLASYSPPSLTGTLKLPSTIVT